MISPLSLLDAEPVWKWGSSNATRFASQITNYLGVVSQTKREPRMSGMVEGEQRATTFATLCRALKRKNRLPLHIQQQLEKLPFWDWAPQTNKVQTHIHRVHDFVTAHNRLPSPTNDGLAGNSLAILRCTHRRRRMSDEVRQACERISCWKWSQTKVGIFERHIQDIIQFIITNGHEPSTLGGPEEARLARPLQKARHKHRYNKLSPSRVLLCETIPGFKWDPDGVEARNRRQQALKQKETKHGKTKKRLPSPNQGPKGRS
jgi:hypothetical protein